MHYLRSHMKCLQRCTGRWPNTTKRSQLRNRDSWSACNLQSARQRMRTSSCNMRCAQHLATCATVRNCTGITCVAALSMLSSSWSLEDSNNTGRQALSTRVIGIVCWGLNEAECGHSAGPHQLPVPHAILAYQKSHDSVLCAHCHRNMASARCAPRRAHSEVCFQHALHAHKLKSLRRCRLDLCSCCKRCSALQGCGQQCRVLQASYAVLSSSRHCKKSKGADGSQQRSRVQSCHREKLELVFQRPTVLGLAVCIHCRMQHCQMRLQLLARCAVR